MRMHQTVYMSVLILQSLLLFEMFASLLLRSSLVGYVAMTGLLYPMLEIEVCFPYYLRILSFLINILQILFYSRIYDYGYCCTEFTRVLLKSPFYYSLFMISSPAHFSPSN